MLPAWRGTFCFAVSAALRLSSDIPDATTLGRFRQQLVDRDLWEKLLGEVNRQLEAQHIIMTEARVNIIDATPVEAAQSGPGKGVDGNPTKDGEAGWHVKQDSRGKPEVHLWLQCAYGC